MLSAKSSASDPASLNDPENNDRKNHHKIYWSIFFKSGCSFWGDVGQGFKILYMTAC